jgi:hypothetical protein
MNSSEPSRTVCSYLLNERDIRLQYLYFVVYLYLLKCQNQEPRPRADYTFSAYAGRYSYPAIENIDLEVLLEVEVVSVVVLLTNVVNLVIF